jgi:selenium-binding protein 1
MGRWRPDPTFYPSPALAMEAAPEELAYVALLAPGGNGARDGIGVVDTNPTSATFGRLIGRTDFPQGGNELHHFGWNACSSHLCPYAPHAHVERRYLVVPGTGSSRIHILDTQPDPRNPELVKLIEAREIAAKTGYAAPHTVHCGPEGVYVNALGGADGNGPGGIFVLDHDTFDVKGAWEHDRGPQKLAYDFWWHLGFDAMISSEWGTPNMVKDGVNPELLLGGIRTRVARVGPQDAPSPAGARPWRRTADGARAPAGALAPRIRVRRRGDVAQGSLLVDLDVVPRRDHGKKPEWKVKKVIEIPAEPANADDLPPLLKGFGVAPPLVTDLNLSLDDKYLYVSCWGTGELQQYDVSNPHEPRLVGSVKIGGMVKRTAHPGAPDKPLNGAPQMVEVSRDGRRVYLTNSLYTPWDAQFYPDGITGWMTKLDVGAAGGIAFDPTFFVEFEQGMRPHQVRLQGGDASSDSFCFA